MSDLKFDVRISEVQFEANVDCASSSREGLRDAIYSSNTHCLTEMKYSRPKVGGRVYSERANQRFRVKEIHAATPFGPSLRGGNPGCVSLCSSQLASCRSLAADVELSLSFLLLLVNLTRSHPRVVDCSGE